MIRIGRAFGIRLGKYRLGARRSGASAPAPLAYSVIYDFETAAGIPSAACAISQHTGSRKALHNAGLRILGNTTNASQSVSALTTFATDMAGWDVMVMCVDFGSGYQCPMSAIRPSFTVGGITYAYRVQASPLVQFDVPFDIDARGKRWMAYKVSNFKQTDFAGASVTGTGGATKTLNLATINAQGNCGEDIVVDAMVLPATHKPAVMITWDDNNPSQYTDAYPAMLSRALPGTLYVPANLIGGGKTSEANMLTMQANGWAMCVDSEADDKPLTAAPTLAAAITALNANRDAVIAKFGAAGAAHICYSYGRVGYVTGAQTLTLTTYGTDVATIPAATAYTTLAAGMRVTANVGGSVPAGTYVVEVLSPTTVRLSNVIAAGVTSMTFVARILGVAATCNGTTSVTLSSTANLFAGMHLLGGGAADPDTRIVSIDSGTVITADKNVPASVTKADFGYVDGEYWPTKVHDALLANGYKSGRRVNGYYGVYTGFGVDPLATIAMNGLSLDSVASTAVYVAQIQTMVRQRQDIILYGHNPQAGDFAAHWNVIFDAIKALVDAGECECLTVPAWWAKASARAPIQ